ncbi:UxaA family hydrolase [Polycladidibacter hongkongensis]|uniref:UxaA family hydrolase n=1 Tax=Polycladidibacter hongkongensis TaxID=1647556 RepID=UPI0008360164|nr:altronate dehydratase family protein [Pseudovibrio hongkongensis]
MKTHLVIHPSDSVAVAIQSLAKGDRYEGVTLLADVPAGHKFALKDIGAGEDVLKYGNSIGKAKEAIAVGAHVHAHNLKTGLGAIEDYAYEGEPDSAEVAGDAPLVMAYERANGDIGIRNDLWIVPLVGCINGLAEGVAREFEMSGKMPEGSKVIVLSHPYGCSQLGDDLDNTRAILQNFVVHPNAGGVLVMGLGCENNTRDVFEATLDLPDPARVRFMGAQEAEDEFATALAHLEELADNMRDDVRTPVSASKLRIGLKCGGSDGFSGITANPLLGALSDYMCGIGGTTVLTEVPEMFGAERILMARAASRGVFDKIVNLINDFKQYYVDHNQPIYENPSPGNKDGGITTLEEKSLGCTQKAGTALVQDVLGYTDRLSTPGLNLLQAPGNDGTAITALAASGCHLVLFTTGRGNPMGSVVPTVKVASNNMLAERKKHWIDFSAGPIAQGDESIASVCELFVEKVLAIASGERTRNEINRMHDIVIFKSGVTL